MSTPNPRSGGKTHRLLDHLHDAGPTRFSDLVSVIYPHLTVTNKHRQRARYLVSATVRDGWVEKTPAGFRITERGFQILSGLDRLPAGLTARSAAPNVRIFVRAAA